MLRSSLSFALVVFVSSSSQFLFLSCLIQSPHNLSPLLIFLFSKSSSSAKFELWPPLLGFALLPVAMAIQSHVPRSGEVGKKWREGEGRGGRGAKREQAVGENCMHDKWSRWSVWGLCVLCYVWVCEWPRVCLCGQWPVCQSIREWNAGITCHAKVSWALALSYKVRREEKAKSSLWSLLTFTAFFLLFLPYFLTSCFLITNTPKKRQ